MRIAFVVLAGLMLVYVMGGLVLSIATARECQRLGYKWGYVGVDYTRTCDPERVEIKRYIPLDEARRTR